jgi:hypothetical protein
VAPPRPRSAGRPCEHVGHGTHQNGRWLIGHRLRCARRDGDGSTNPFRSCRASVRGAQVAIEDLERARFSLGAVREALDAYSRLLREPYHRLFDPEYGCGVVACCPDVDELRSILHAVAHTLPRRDARQFRRQVAALDENW